MSTSGGSSGGSSGVSSFKTRTGAVVPATGDYTVAQVTGAAPLASPALTGTPTAPTQTALSDNTDVATTAYVDSAVGGSGSTVVGPNTFGYLSWTADPMLCNTGKTPNLGTLYLIRFRCVTGASNGHVGYYISSGGGALTSNENFVGIYDTGQTTPGSATQLAISADQTSNFGTTAYYSVAMTTPETLVQGQDYFFAILCNGTTAPQFYGPPTGANTLINASLSGLALRCGHSVATNLTAMPSAITAANIVSTATNPCGLILV